MLVRERQLELVMVGAEELSHAPGVRELVLGACLGKADREGLHRLAHVPGHEGDDHARVEPAAEHRTQRHVAHQAQTHRLVELLEQADAGSRPR